MLTVIWNLQMGEQSCIFSLATITLTIATVLFCVALSSPEWLIGSPSDEIDSKDQWMKGLWKYCIGDECYSLTHKDVTAWFKTARGLCTTTCILNIISVLVFFLICVLDASVGRLYYTYITVLINLIASTIMSFCTVSIFYLKCTVETEKFPDPSQLYWSFYLASMGTLFNVVSSALVIRQCILARRVLENRAYYDLWFIIQFFILDRSNLLWK